MSVSEEIPVTLDASRPATVLVGRSANGEVTVRIAPEGSLPQTENTKVAGSRAGAAPLRHPDGAPVRNGSSRLSPIRTRVRPARWTRGDVAMVAGSAISAALLCALILGVLGTSPGWVADLVVWYALSLAMIYVATREQLGVQAARDRLATLVMTTGAVLLVAPLVSLLAYVVARGLPHLSWSFFTHDLRAITPLSPPTEGGGLHAIIGTLEQAGLALLFVLPLGLLTAVFLSETRAKARRLVRTVVDAMSGLPSIVAGLFIYSALIINRPADSTLFGFNGLMASLALALVMLPTVTRTVDVVLRLVPDGLREASLALGASRGRTVWSVVLPTARSGVTTAVVLGLARIVGETAPLLFTAFGSTLINANPFSGPQESLPLFVFRFVKAPSENESNRGYVGAVVLIGLVLTLFFVARFIGGGGGRLASRHAARRAGRARLHRETAVDPNRPLPVEETRDYLADPAESDVAEVGLEGDPMDDTVTLPAYTEPMERTSDAYPTVTLTGGPPEGASQLEAQSVCAWFGDRLVLEDVDLVMPANRVTALIGPSGCGKSTFLRILNRMHELVPSASLSGEVLLDGRDVYDPRMRAQAVRARVGMVFQKPNPFPAMSIRDNVLSGLKLGGIGCSDKDELVEQSLERAGLWREVRDRLDSPGGALSGGQQQRLCIARSLAVRPNVLLMDEPCSALDPTSTRRIEETIHHLSDDVTVIIVTHNMQQAQRVSDFCAFFLAAENEPGRVVEHGDTAAVFENPVDPRTFDYVNGRFG